MTFGKPKRIFFLWLGATGGGGGGFAGSLVLKGYVLDIFGNTEGLRYAPASYS